jgi:fructokinase
MTSIPIVVGLGEILWDLLPSGRQLGGAPANFAYCSHLLGNRAVVASRIGNDQLGTDICDRLFQTGIARDFLQTDNEHPTGTVKVTLDSSGQPSYDIVEDVAWDFMECSPEWQSLAQSAQAVCFGTLAQRSSKSQETIHQFLKSTREETLRIFDLNLRQEFYSEQMITESLRLSDIVKLNREESTVLGKLLGLSNRAPDDLSFCRELMQKFELRSVCVTYGSEGSLLCDELHEHRHSGFKVAIKDTVGSGDAFTAGLAHGMLNGRSLAEINDLANRMGAWVATSSGGMPPEPEAGLRRTLEKLG